MATRHAPFPPNHLDHFRVIIGALSGLGCGEHKITSHKSKPEATIADPTEDDRLVENIPYVVMGQVDDDDEAADSLVTHWRIGTRDACSDDPSADGSTQCELTMRADDPMMVRSRSRSRSWTPEMRTPRRT